MKKLFIFLFLMILLVIPLVSAAEWDNVFGYSNEDLKVTISNSFLLLFPTTKIGTAELKSHSFVNEVKQVSVGDQVVMWYDFDFIELYENGLGELTFKNMRTGEYFDRDYELVYWGEKEVNVYGQGNCKTILLNGTQINCEEVIIGKTKVYDWLPYNSNDIPEGNIRIGVVVNVKSGEKTDVVWTIAGKDVSRHAAFTGNGEFSNNIGVSTTDASDYNMTLKALTDGVLTKIRMGSASATAVTSQITIYQDSIQLAQDNITYDFDDSIAQSTLTLGTEDYSSVINSSVDGGMFMIWFYKLGASNQYRDANGQEFNGTLFEYATQGTMTGKHGAADAGPMLTFNETEVSEMVVTLISPINNTQTNDDPIIFTARLTPTSYNLTNATVYVWYSNGTLWKTETNLSVSGNESINVTIPVATWDIGDYLWNVYGCQGNCNGTNATFAANNFTLEWIPFEVSAESYETNTYETKDENFYINITTDATVSNMGAFLVYNDSFYAGVHSCSGGLCQIEREIDIPLLDTQSLSSENNTFYWQITLFGAFGTFTTNTTSYEQNASNIIFTGDDTGNAKSVNFTIHNETTLGLMNADFKATFSYYLGNGTVQEKNNYSSSGARGYPFYINHNLTFITTSQIEIKNGTNERKYYLLKELYTNTTTIHPLYIPDVTVSNIIIEVKDQGLIPKADVLVNISRFYPGINQYKMIESQITDEFGQILAKLVEYNAKYRFAFYDLDNTLLKISEGITITCRSAYCIIPFVIEEITDEFERFENLTTYSYTFSFDNTTNIFTFSWDDQRGELATTRLEVTRYLLNGSAIVCNTSSTSILSTLTCDVGSQRASYKAQVFRSVNNERKRISLLNIKVADPASTFGVEGLLWVFLLLFTCIGIGAFNPSVGAGLYGAGFVIMGVVGIISMPVPVFFANTLLVILFIWGVNK